MEEMGWRIEMSDQWPHHVRVVFKQGKWGWHKTVPIEIVAEEPEIIAARVALLFGLSADTLLQSLTSKTQYVRAFLHYERSIADDKLASLLLRAMYG